MAVRREDLRAADADRAFVAERLKAAFDEGRLSMSDYDERLQFAYKATTYGDLDRVLADLPVTGQDEAQLVPAGSYHPGSHQPAQASMPLLAQLQTIAAWRLLLIGVVLIVLVAVVMGGMVAIADR
jgi:Domain of unknown function (DUF1707)